MMVPEGILCTKSHEYLLDNGDSTYTVGLTDYAVEQLGDIVFVEFPEVGAEFSKGDVFATVESVKAASEIYMPVGGKILEVNEQIVETPELLNESPFGDGWLVKIAGDAVQEDSGDLLEYSDYKEELE